MKLFLLSAIKFLGLLLISTTGKYHLQKKKKMISLLDVALQWQAISIALTGISSKVYMGAVISAIILLVLTVGVTW